MSKYIIKENGVDKASANTMVDLVAKLGVTPESVIYHINSGKKEFKIKNYTVKVNNASIKKPTIKPPIINKKRTFYTIVGSTGKVYANLTRTAACARLKCSGNLLTDKKQAKALPFKHRSYIVYESNKYNAPKTETIKQRDRKVESKKPTNTHNVGDYKYTVELKNKECFYFTQKKENVSNLINIPDYGLEFLENTYGLPYSINGHSVYDATKGHPNHGDTTPVVVPNDDLFVTVNMSSNLSKDDLNIYTKHNRDSLSKVVDITLVDALVKKYSFPVTVNDITICDFNSWID